MQKNIIAIANLDDRNRKGAIKTIKRMAKIAKLQRKINQLAAKNTKYFDSVETTDQKLSKEMKKLKIQ